MIPAEAQTYRVHIGGARCNGGQECVELDHSVVGVAVPAEAQQDDERAREQNELRALRAQVVRLKGKVAVQAEALAARPSADTETLREDGVALIAAERRRQVDAEGWTPEHDAEHTGDALALAAVCYALPFSERPLIRLPRFWPWRESYWKPTPHDRVRELVKAGALIAAEIDRLRAALDGER